ncbi:MAG: hypothetical protein R3F56_04980 [Planctomycetota bacterium]
MRTSLARPLFGAAPCFAGTLGLLVLAAAAPAQAIVHPQHFTRAEAPYANVLPFGWTNVPIRLLQVHAGVPAGTIRGMAFRLDAGQTTDVAAFQAVVEVEMSSSVTSVLAPNATFDANHGADRTTVLPATVVNFAAAPRTLAPRPFLHTLAFSTPFNYGGAVPLCWDMRISNRSATTNFEYDQAITSANPPATIMSFGDGCRLFGATAAMTLSASSTTNWSGATVTFRFAGSRLPPSSVVALSTGVSTASLNGVPLPFVLPGSAASPSGPCTIYNDSLLQLPVFTTASGALATNTNVTFPLRLSMNGASLFTQVLAADPQANPWGVTTSNSVQMHLTAPFTNDAVSRVWVGGSLVANGRVDARYGAVVRFMR